MNILSPKFTAQSKNMVPSTARKPSAMPTDASSVKANRNITTSPTRAISQRIRKHPLNVLITNDSARHPTVPSLSSTQSIRLPTQAQSCSNNSPFGKHASTHNSSPKKVQSPTRKHHSILPPVKANAMSNSTPSSVPSSTNNSKPLPFLNHLSAKTHFFHISLAYFKKKQYLCSRKGVRIGDACL